MSRWHELHAKVTEGHATPYHLGVDLGACHARLETNDEALYRALTRYFGPLYEAPRAESDIVIKALQMPEPDLGVEFIDWPRDTGKKGRKDSYLDLPEGRVLRKVRTGMQYFVGEERWVFGDCRENYNQVVNFLNSQHIGWALDREWRLCHAAAVKLDGHGVAIAAHSGGGKSTLALTLMRHGGVFVSNDRLLIKRDRGDTAMLGVAKRPRINPGTVLNNPDLGAVMPSARAAELRDLDHDELWELEEKYDVDVPAIWGTERWRLDAGLQHLVLLGWDRFSHAPTEIGPLDELNDANLRGLMKSAGPFRLGPREPLRSEDYAPHLDGVKIHVLRGGVDFDRAAGLILRELG